MGEFYLTEKDARIAELEAQKEELRLLAVDLAKGRPITADRHRLLTSEGEK